MGKKEQQVTRIAQACRLLFTNNADSALFAGRHQEFPLSSKRSQTQSAAKDKSFDAAFADRIERW